MLAAGANVVDEQVVMGNLVAVLGVVPEPTYVLDELAIVVDERVIQSDHALGAVAGRRVALQQFESPLIEGLLVPGNSREEAIQARLVGCLCKLAVDPGHGLVRGHHQAGEILGEVPPLRIAGEQITELIQRFAHHLGILDNGWHLRALPGPLDRPGGPAQTKTPTLDPKTPIFPTPFKSLQKSSPKYCDAQTLSICASAGRSTRPRQKSRCGVAQTRRLV